jgi:hypothetical protein
MDRGKMQDREYKDPERVGVVDTEIQGHYNYALIMIRALREKKAYLSLDCLKDEIEKALR